MKSFNFTLQVVTGLLLGICAGVFFGEYCKVFEPIGAVFIMLLEAFLYPFLVCSLLYGIGKLAPQNFMAILKRGWFFYLIAWLITLISLGLLLRSLPTVAPLVIDPSHVSDSMSQFLKLFFPQNLFTDFTRNFVPAVVVFSVLLGLAVQRVPNKQAALDVFEAISKSSIAVWKGIIKFSPIAVFALFANLAGTISIDRLDRLMVYLLLFLIASLVLTFWIMPGLISAFIDYPITQLIKRMFAGIFMGAATMLPVTSIPYVLNLVGELSAERGLKEEVDGGLKGTIMSFSYPLVQLGNLFVYLFMGFVAFYHKHPLTLFEELMLPVLSLFSTFGTPVSTVNAISFLSQWLDFSGDNTVLYVELMTITRYFQVIVTSAGLYFVTIIITFAYYRKLRINLGRLTLHLGLPLILLGITAYGLFEVEKARHADRSHPWTSLALPADVGSGVEATVYRNPDQARRKMLGNASHNGEGVLEAVQKRGLLRVGYNATPLPFSYFNDQNELVGYDVAFAYELAGNLGVHLEFVPFTWKGLIEDLSERRFDIAISGIYVTKERIRALTVSTSYFKSRVVMVVPSGNSKGFYSKESMKSMKGLSIAVFDDHVLLEFVRKTFPEAKVVLVSSLDDMAAFENFDSIIWTKPQAMRLAAMKSDLSVVITDNLHTPLLFSYMMPPGAEELRTYINYWLELKKEDGFSDRMKAYWFEGKTDLDAAPRWSIIRNVLHWVQ